MTTDNYLLKQFNGFTYTANDVGKLPNKKGLINQKNGLSCDPTETLGISGVQTKYRFQNLQ